MSKRFWRDFVASNDHGLWRGAIPQAPTSPEGVKENFHFDLAMRLAKAEENRERLGELLADLAHEGRVRVEPAEATDAVEPAAPDPKNKGGRPSLETERLKLMQSLLAAHSGDESSARAAYIKTLTTPGTDWAHRVGLVSPKHAGDNWHDLRPKLGRRALKRRRKRNN